MKILIKSCICFYYCSISYLCFTLLSSSSKTDYLTCHDAADVDGAADETTKNSQVKSLTMKDVISKK